MTAGLREAFVMNFVREHRISQSKAAEILGISEDMFPLISKHQARPLPALSRMRVAAMQQ
jgi:hypothetical protein